MISILVQEATSVNLPDRRMPRSIMSMARAGRMMVSLLLLANRGNVLHRFSSIVRLTIYNKEKIK